jgi:nicotinamidase-related amidase
LAKRYPFKLLDLPVSFSDISFKNTALLIIDLQKYYTDINGGISELSHLKGVESEFKDYYVAVKFMLENIKTVLSKTRKDGIKNIFIRTRSHLITCEDLSETLKVRENYSSFKFDDSNVDFTIAPTIDEVVLDKICYNPFNCTGLDNILRNCGVKYLLICGPRTSSHFDATILDAVDRGFTVLIISDACADHSALGTHAEIEYLSGGMISVRTTQSVLELLESLGGDNVD